jgi:hypothetical protein
VSLNVWYTTYLFLSLPKTAEQPPLSGHARRILGTPGRDSDMERRPIPGLHRGHRHRPKRFGRCVPCGAFEPRVG